MFAGYHSFVPVIFGKLFRKPSIIVAGGIDCVSFPSVKYGNFSKFFLGKITEWSFKLCTHIAPISEYLVESKYIYDNNDYKKQGFLAFSNELKTPYTVVYNGFEIPNWFNMKLTRISNSFLTVAANLDDPRRVKIKGIDIILEAAKQLPDCTFTIIGKGTNPEFFSQLPNVKVIPPVLHNELKNIYNQYEFYLQVSLSEGFGNTLAESMLCGCIPIGSNAGAIPMIIADTGFILKKKDPQMLVELLKTAVNCDKETLSKKARERIINNFSIERREKELLGLVEKLIRDNESK